MTAERTDVVVVGLGAMGSAAAWQLASRGVDVIGLEQFEFGHARGSSHGPTRIFRLSYPFPDYVRMAQRALELWRRLEDEAGERLLVTTGGLDAGKTAQDCAASLRACGVHHEWLGRAEARERFPAISLDPFDRVLHQPDAGVSLADNAVAAMLRRARQLGAEIREEAAVSAIRPTGDGLIVEWASGEIRTGRVVLTPGAWAAKALAMAGIDLPVRAHLQTVSYFHQRDQHDLPTFIEWTDGSTSWYEVPKAGGAAGVKVAGHVPGRSIDPSRASHGIDDDSEKANADYVARRFPGLDRWPVASETCLYEMTPDEHFVLDREGPVVIGCGFSGHGFKFAPLIGEVLADLTQERDPPVPLDRFGALRFRNV
jgi:sarcosine oxidase